MSALKTVLLLAVTLQGILAIKVKMVVHSEQDESRLEDDLDQVSTWDHKKKEPDATLLPFIRKRKPVQKLEPEEEISKVSEPAPTTTERWTHPNHPNDLLFPLIYKQKHVNSMFKFGDNWYTWTSATRADRSKGVSYYICYEEPKHCDDIGWEHIDAPPKCAFQIESLTSDDRACLHTYGVPARAQHACDGAEQIKVNDILKSCGPRIRTLWRFVRAGRRPADAPKPADVNSLICEDEEECYVSLEYRIHRDRITYSLHEPTRGQTFKSSLKRDNTVGEERASSTETTPRARARPHPRGTHKKADKGDGDKKRQHKKKHEGKGLAKERDDTDDNRRYKNKLKTKDDISDDISID